MPEHAGLQTRVETWRARSEVTLERILPSAHEPPQRLHAAMRHAALDGGKRMRPLLVYATGTAFGIDESKLDALGAAVELIHAYSLVHDDLPAMDDDALRRGKPTLHIAYDDATAILAGDALQSLAFGTIAMSDFDADIRIAMLRELALAAGSRGMCGGQAMDLDATGQAGSISAQQLEQLHAMKTGALLRASVRIGAFAARVDIATAERLDRYADALGLAFQIRDDLLDIEGDSATLGKTAGKDAVQAKATFPALLGIEASQARLLELADMMETALAPDGERMAALAALGRRVITRNH